MDKKVRIGLIGVGNIAQNAHIPAYLKQKDVELVACYDIKAERAKEVAAKYGMTAEDSLEALVARDDLDAVSVCTWNNGHAHATIAALKAGKHVLCEKPMAMNPAECEAMIAAQKESGKLLMMGFVYRFSASAKAIKAMTDEGRFGNIYHARAGILRRRGTPLGWFTDLSKSGGGPVIDIGVHVIDLTWYLMGKPKPVSVCAQVHNRIGDYKTKGVSRWEALDKDNLVFETEDSAAGIVKFENDVSMIFEVSWAINGQEEGVTAKIYGDKAGASYNPCKIYGEEAGYLSDNDINAGREDNFYNEIRHFIDCIKGDAQCIATGEDGLVVQKILNGIYQSSAEKREIIL